MDVAPAILPILFRYRKPLYRHPAGEAFLSGRGFVAVGYTKRYLCRQPQPKTAIPGGIAVIAWVDATNIKINPSENAPLVGARDCQAATSGGSWGLRTATKSQAEKQLTNRPFVL